MSMGHDMRRREKSENDGNACFICGGCIVWMEEDENEQVIQT